MIFSFVKRHSTKFNIHFRLQKNSHQHENQKILLKVPDKEQLGKKPIANIQLKGKK